MLGTFRQKSRHGTIIFLTGAGVSAESGIPTFRGAEGYWSVGSHNYHPQEMATNYAFSKMPWEVWAWYLYRRTICHKAAPNEAHLALVEAEKILGERFLLVTQNVDGLHLRAGNSPERTFEIHGNADYFRCSAECQNYREFIGARAGDFEKQQKCSPADMEALRCPHCGDLARPHVLWFDESYDEERYRYTSSLQAAQKCSVLVSMGTSGATNLPMQMGGIAARKGALLVDINPESNPFSQMAQSRGGVWLKSSASKGIAQLIEALR